MKTEDFASKWAVVITVSEPSELVLANVAHHLTHGASEIFVYLDTPDAELEAVLAAHPACHVALCDAAYWQVQHGMKKPPARHTRRQTLNADLAAKTTRAAWLLNIDADEFLWCEGRFADILTTVPESAGWIKLRPWERRRFAGRAEGLFDGRFLGLHVLPSERPLTEGGFTGHLVGKACVRTGRGYALTLHNPRIGPVKERSIPKSFEDDNAYLLHFDGLTPLHWASKLLRRAEKGPEYVRNNYRGKRLRQIYLAAQTCGDPANLAKLQNEVTYISPERAEVLTGEGMLRMLDLQIPQALNTQFSNEVVDLTTQHFDKKIAPLLDQLRARVAARGDVWGVGK
ncbi:glycosyltransferase family 2 protein [Falsihalocynthiibacter sp. S25ZX9]|uniref:glycosyltransferase family 2 protein n=1 Tax=unclassified Falsihalocynthiibacter TaxID=2854191 RepID=UPI00350EDABA